MNLKLSLGHRRGVQFCESCIPELPLIFVVFTKKREEFILGPGDCKKVSFFLRALINPLLCARHWVSVFMLGP